ncbi:hypothetical protein HK097_000758, partial [Rhizophlyctis rosea]
VRRASMRSAFCNLLIAFVKFKRYPIKKEGIQYSICEKGISVRVKKLLLSLKHFSLYEKAEFNDHNSVYEFDYAWITESTALLFTTKGACYICKDVHNPRGAHDVQWDRF